MSAPKKRTGKVGPSMKEFPLSKVCTLIERGPAVLVTTLNEGRANVMTMSWNMFMDYSPPRIGCVIGPWDHSFEALRGTGECVIAVPTVDLANKVVDIGNCSGRDLDKFETFGLTAVPAEEVAPPLIAECLANLECRVIDTAMVDKYNLFILAVVRAWIDPERKERRMIHHNGDGTFVVDGRSIDLKARMTKWQQFV
jgi:flavin reductase (DIM6/NTAB) family NADH-FMN oxidoreductase RutF